MLQPKTNTIYNAALYCRLSKDDGVSDRDSSSIENQRDILARFCTENGIIIHDYYVDDGYSGTNFERPAFKRMIEDIENGKVNCVITKDQSRLGRNHLETGYFMEVYFNEHNVRYIAIGDNVDTINASTMDIAPFRNLLNDMYAKDISKKVKAAILSKQKQGKFFGNKAPFGYIKDPEDKNHLLVDERYAPVIRRIFDMYLDEYMGCRAIALKLTEEKVPRPCVAAAEHSQQYESYTESENGKYRWSGYQISNIIRNPVYAGNMRGQFRPTKGIRSSKKYSPDQVSFIVYDTHEAIIPQERWNTAQEMLSSHRRDKVDGGYVNIFTGILKCADCGHAMTISQNKKATTGEPIDNASFSCCEYRAFGKTACSSHTIRARDLYDAVLADVQRLAKYAVDHDDTMITEIIKKLHNDASDDTQKREREIRKSKKRLSELDKMFSSLYEDKVKVNISEHNYKQLAASYETEQQQLERQITEYEESLRNTKAETDNAECFVNLMKEHAGIEELTAAVLHTLIDKILVHELEVIDGEKVQKIEIYYKFVGNFDIE